MSIVSNLRTRARLLRAALTRRYVYREIVNLALEVGNLPVTDVVGDLEPIELCARLGRGKPYVPPDFSRIVPSDVIVESAATTSWTSEPATAQFIGRLAALMQAKVVFEIGCFTGYTTVHLAMALQPSDGHIHYLDFDRSHLDTATKNLQRLGLHARATPYCGASVAPAVLAALPARADLIFIDTTHEYSDTVAEIAAYRQRLSPGGVIVLHDSIRFAGVRRAIAEVYESFGVLTFATERGNGLTVLVPRTGNGSV